MTKKYHTSIITFIFSVTFLACSNNVSDPDLIIPDGNGDEILTALGCLVNGPWNIDNQNTGFNEKLFLDNLEIISRPQSYTDVQKDLVFELHKNGRMSFWFKSENGFKNDTNEIKVSVRQPRQMDHLKKTYDLGYWKASFEDSSLLLVFNNKKLPKLHLKWVNLGSAYANFQQIYFFDTIYNGKNVTLKKISTYNYIRLYPRF